MALDNDDLFSFGVVLKGFRVKRRLTQKQLAARLGVGRNMVGTWERGDYLPANKAQVLELARHLHLDEQEKRQLLEASLTALAPHWSVSLPRNPYFTGREKILEALHEHLKVDQATAIMHSLALRGLGGVGKTQIALEYAYRYALEYSAVFWISAETVESIVSSLLYVAETLRLPEREDKNQQRVFAAVQRWLSTHGKWLLIWDNVEDLALLDSFLPSARSGVNLLTTRHHALGIFARGLDLTPMEQSEGMLFLLRRAKALGAEATGKHVQQFARHAPPAYEAATELVTALGGLPLALDQAGAYIEETQCGFSGYLQSYEQRHSQLLDRRGAFADHPQSVASTFSLACQQIARQNPAALELLRFCAWLSPDAIPETLFFTHPTCLGPILGPAAADPFQLDQALAVLLGLSLIHRHTETRMLSIHRLVQIVLRESMQDRERTRWLLRAVQVLARLFPEVSSESPVEVWKQCEHLLPHVLTVNAALSNDPGNQDL
ncbi:MAG TPA: helix-turn-helix domain-containing protein, partial [Ktedonobacteraceae bacterium]|nr:helix-turn-helix domain-containing protein [Ktedonobacteraceae bacterium]